MKLVIETDDGKAVCYQNTETSVLKIDQIVWLRDNMAKAILALGLDNVTV